MFVVAPFCLGVVAATMSLGSSPRTELDNLDDADVTGLTYSEDTDVLLVKQLSSISVFKLSGQGALKAERLSRLPIAHDNTTRGTVAHVLNATHFIYCDARQCSVCPMTNGSACLHGNLLGPVDLSPTGRFEASGQLISVTMIKGSAVLFKVTLGLGLCVTTFTKVVELVAGPKPDGYTSLITENILTYNLTDPALEETFFASLDGLRETGQDYVQWLLGATLTTFVFNGYAFALVKGDFEYPSDPLVLIRYERAPNRKFVRKGITLKCRDRPNTCPDIPYKCNDTGDYLAATFREESATFIDGHLYVAYENSILVLKENERESPRLHALCLFDLDEFFEAFDTIASCEDLDQHSCEMDESTRNARSCYKDDDPPEYIADGQVFAKLADDDNRRWSTFAFDRRRNTIFLADGAKVQYMTATCNNLYVDCLEENSSLRAVKGEKDEDCVWCAQNNSVYEGHAIAYHERDRCDGTILLDACPPRIFKVTRNASTYRIEGENLNSVTTFVDDGEYPSVSACGEQCYLTSSKWSNTSLVCTVENDTSSCDIITFRTKAGETLDVFLAKLRYVRNVNGQTPYNSKPLRRYYGSDETILTFVHAVEDELVPDRRQEFLQLSLLFLSLCSTGLYTAYVKIRHYQRRKEWETTLEKLEDMEEIDRGSFGTVYCAKHDGAWVAVKLLKGSDVCHFRRQFENEIWLLKTLGMRYRHPHVIRLLWVVLKPKIAIVTELCHDSLHRQIHDYKRTFESATLLDFCSQIASGMLFLHAKGVVHRDLKSGNVLMTDKDGTTLKICDFGMSNLKPSRWSLASSDGYFAGSLLWMAPEIVAPNAATARPYTFASDIYAFGICVYELITSRLPYAALDEAQIIWQVAQGTLRPDYSLVKEGQYAELLQTLSEWSISFRPGARPTFETISSTIASHSFNKHKSQECTSVVGLRARTFPTSV